jgi:hypothetical protein
MAVAVAVAAVAALAAAGRDSDSCYDRKNKGGNLNVIQTKT